MAFRRRDEPSIDEEREALRAQHAALEDLKHELAERVAAVRERELELQWAIADAAGPRGEPAVGLPPLPPVPRAETDVDTDEDALAASRRAQELDAREQELAGRETRILEREQALDRPLADERARLDARERELDVRAAELAGDAPSAAIVAAATVARAQEPDTADRELAAELAEREQAIRVGEEDLARRERELELRIEREAARLEARGQEIAARADQPPGQVDADRLARIEARLEELREAEKLFLRTRDELAARSEAVAARERLAAQKERELDERDDAVDPWGGPAVSEMEARLRRLEQQQRPPDEQTQGFSGGLRKLQQGTTKPQRPT